MSQETRRSREPRSVVRLESMYDDDHTHILLAPAGMRADAAIDAADAVIFRFESEVCAAKFDSSIESPFADWSWDEHLLPKLEEVGFIEVEVGLGPCWDAC